MSKWSGLRVLAVRSHHSLLNIFLGPLRPRLLSIFLSLRLLLRGFLLGLLRSGAEYPMFEKLLRCLRNVHFAVPDIIQVHN